MSRFTRRGAFGSFLTGLTLLGASGRAEAATASAAPAPPPDFPQSDLRWAKGFEGQRRADLGDGTFLNPILSGDRPDPSILKDGADYYICHSSFDAYPGVLIWRSRDLVNWTKVTAALTTYIGSVWAPELCKHEGRYFLYLPARTAAKKSIYVITADRIEGPWSEPVDLDLPSHIDPGHAVDPDGTRWLFLSGGDRVRLSPDGLSKTGPVEHVYDPWRPPADWVLEGFSPEGPKVMRRGDFHYLITAVGGTAGPPTGHMVICARARDLAGPWENCPANPLVRTTTAAEKWWSRGHATLVEGPAGDWWSVYHGYEAGFWTLGRQTLLAPVTWSAEGWPVFGGGDLARPIRKPSPTAATPHGAPLSDNFTSNQLGTKWTFYDPGPGETGRLKIGGGVLRLAAKGSTPANSSPLSFLAGDLAYQVSVEVEIDPKAQAGLLLFYNRRLYCGLAFSAAGLVMHRQGLERGARKPEGAPEGPLTRLFLRGTNDHHIVTWETSFDGQTWSRFDVRMEVSGYHHNTAYDFLSLRPALYVAGEGEARFRNLKFRALDTLGGEHGA